MMLRITRLKIQVLKGLLLSLIAACSSTPPVDETKPAAKVVPKNSVLEEVTESDSKSELMAVTQDPTYTELMQLLESLGYEGVGLQFESQDRLNLLIQVFSNPKTAHRYLRLVYTGTQWNYDLKHQSLTVGEGKDAAGVIAFIEKNIKLKPLPLRKPIVKKSPVPSPLAVPFPKKLPVDATEKLKQQTPEPPPSPADNSAGGVVTQPPTPSPTQVPSVTETPIAVPTESPLEIPTPSPEANRPSDDSPVSPFQKDTPEPSPNVTPESTSNENQPM